MTTTRTPSQQGRSNRRKGHDAERNLATYLRDWWPEARRAVVTGSSVRGGDGVVREQPDPGDVAGVPFLVSVKDCSVETIDAWLTELDVMATLAGDTVALRFLVVKRRGTAPERWWCWQRANQYAALFGGRTSLIHPVRVEMRHAVVDLLHAGYASSRGGAA